jgi:hypothetical protein
LVGARKAYTTVALAAHAVGARAARDIIRAQHTDVPAITSTIDAGLVMFSTGVLNSIVAAGLEN